MFQSLELFQMSHAMAHHAGQRQALVAENMANSDTPNFRPRDMTPFAEIVKRGDMQLATRPGHLNGTMRGAVIELVKAGTTTESPNGNAVSVEDEMLRAVDVKRQHDRALAIYRHSMTVLRASLGRQ